MKYQRNVTLFACSIFFFILHCKHYHTEYNDDISLAWIGSSLLRTNRHIVTFLQDVWWIFLSAHKLTVNIAGFLLCTDGICRVAKTFLQICWLIILENMSTIHPALSYCEITQLSCWVDLLRSLLSCQRGREKIPLSAKEKNSKSQLRVAFNKPLYQSEAWCTTVHMKMSLICMWVKSYFVMKGWAPRLALRKRLKVIQKWPAGWHGCWVRPWLDHD